MDESTRLQRDIDKVGDLRDRYRCLTAEFASVDGAAMLFPRLPKRCDNAEPILVVVCIGDWRVPR